MADEIREILNIEAELIAGGGGIFQVDVDGKTVYTKAETGRFPEKGEVVKIIQNQG